ncbi:SDR family NAD(P)-dependent oxidoreductase [Marinifilum caeruleilacunae]|uniref:SDR family NAD(P)-dependent oxidoreductase n=1 Tax=Marinifilum caeruleilacunae TaxID=2499076 RepID=A0ABX1WW89_9BACT|nr:SDR family NAD(P)-dependent oxidoreductase [Marinifilum caeruleilacunae]NOU60155.1 SDR family NAD(P)-dependent oxidoreductase [Marinifilum caeruleilacunae]
MKKTILITGSTDGIGKLTATKLAADGHEVYLHGRNKNKLDAVISEIISATGNKSVKGFVADFSDLEAVKQMTQQVNSDLSKLDVLINNAGVFHSPESHNKNGLELRFVVNYFAQVLFTNELLPLLKKSEQARVVNLSSAAQSSISFEALKGEESIGVSDAYAQSKLAFTMWSFYMAREVPELMVVAVNPGSLLNTKMANEAYGQYWSPAEKGADILIALGVSDEFSDVSGKYFDNDRASFAMAHPDAYDQVILADLIELTQKMIG